MKKIQTGISVLLALLVACVFVSPALAHPLGNFTINHYAGLYVSEASISIDYVLDMAEIPAFQEIAEFDANGNGQADPFEAARYQAAKCASLKSDLSLRLNGKDLMLDLGTSSVEFPQGAGGLKTLRLTCRFSVEIADKEAITSLFFADNAYSERLGWREIVVYPDGVELNGTFSVSSISERLTSYPDDLLSSPLDQREITLGMDVVSTVGDTPVEQSGAITSIRPDRFTELITLENLTPATLSLALLIAFVWGATHAMTPGHGKTIVGAYLVGSRGTVKHALYLGLTTTITHTLGVFALGLLTLFAANYIVPERLFPWMTLLSGLFVMGIGLNLFIERIRSSESGRWLRKWNLKRAALQPAFSPAVNRLQIESSQHEHSHALVFGAQHRHSHGHGHSHAPHHEHDHTHEPSNHSHMPPESITWRSLLALGVSGGLLPCPSALVVLLGAIALNKIGFGMILVLAFSLGLAGALTGIGVLFIYAGKLFRRFPSSGRVIGFLPVLSAFFVSLIGAGIVYKALVEIGIL